MASVYNIPFGRPALAVLAEHLRQVYADTPHRLAETVVLLPTRRACLGLEGQFKQYAPTFIPKVLALPDLEADPTTLGYIPKTLEIWSKQQLTCQITKLLAPQLPKLQLLDHFKLADQLATVIDEVQTAGLPLQNLQKIQLDSQSEYWQLTKDILHHVIEGLGKAQEQQSAKTTFAHKRDNLAGIAKLWQQRPPKHDVWLVGTTATRAGTRQLAQCINGMGNGHIVLTGVMEQGTEQLPNSHPNITIRSMLEHMGNPTVTTLGTSSTHTFLSQAMSSALDSAYTNLPEHVHMLEADNPSEEAELIALIMRHTLEQPHKTVALITPDQDLMARVTAQLKLWNIVPDISLGKPFSATAVGQLFSITSQWLASPDAVTLLSTLKHPLCGKPERAAHLQALRYYEKEYLRAVDHHYSWAQLRSEIAQDPKLACWADTVAAVTLPPPDAKPFAEWMSAHVELMHKLADLPEAPDTEMLNELCQSLPEALKHLPTISLGEYQRILQYAVAGVTIRDVAGIGSRVKYLGVLEARLHTADVVIMSGLNEGTWPQVLDSGPWLNRVMRESVGLPPLEQRLGLAAHDFCSGFAAQQVYLTRSQQQDGAPTLASRNLRRVQLYHDDVVRSAYQEILALRRKVEPQPITPPQPCPPISARPAKFSVTDIERLLRDPYAIYAKRILKLKPLEPIDGELAAVDRGNLIHLILDQYLSGLSHITEARTDSLLEYAKHFFRPIWDKPWVAQFWWPRFCQVAEWLVPICNNSHDVDCIQTELWLDKKLEIAGVEHTISAKVDRVDHLTDDTYRVIDYKTGLPPSVASVKLGISPQLSLEGWLLDKGRSILLEYWQLSGGKPAGHIRKIADADEIIEQAGVGVSKLLHYFQRSDTLYRACPNPKTAPMYSDYQHIERRAEWG